MFRASSRVAATPIEATSISPKSPPCAVHDRLAALAMAALATSARSRHVDGSIRYSRDLRGVGDAELVVVAERPCSIRLDRGLRDWRHRLRVARCVGLIQPND
jgi:hypothetical protein